VSRPIINPRDFAECDRRHHREQVDEKDAIKEGDLHIWVETLKDIE